MTLMRLLKCRESSANPTQVTPSRAAILQCVVMVSYMCLIHVSHHVVLEYMCCAAASEACHNKRPRCHQIQTYNDGFSI
jgi:hypothetical protein